MAGGRAGQGMKISADAEMHFIEKRAWHPPSPFFMAPPAGFEPVACRLGEPLNICHLCSPMYRKVAIRQAFFIFRVAPCSSKFTGVVRCSPVHFSSFLDFSKKGNKNIFYLLPILAHFRVKIHMQSNRKPKRNISRLPEKHSLGKTIKKRVLHSRFE